MLPSLPAGMQAELKRCMDLGLVLYNLHPGWHKGWATKEECMDQVRLLLTDFICALPIAGHMLDAWRQKCTATASVHTANDLKGALMLQVADAINRAHKETSGVKVLLENMSGQGSALGSAFEELRCAALASGMMCHVWARADPLPAQSCAAGQCVLSMSC